MGRTPLKKPLAWRKTRIKDWRDHRGLTQQQVADRLADLRPPIATTRESIQRIENGTQRPGIDLIEGIAKVLGVDVDTLLNVAPDDAGELIQFRALDRTERQRAFRLLDAARED